MASPLANSAIRPKRSAPNSNLLRKPDATTSFNSQRRKMTPAMPSMNAAAPALQAPTPANMPKGSFGFGQATRPMSTMSPMSPAATAASSAMMGRSQGAQLQYQQDRLDTGMGLHPGMAQPPAWMDLTGSGPRPMQPTSYQPTGSMMVPPKAYGNGMVYSPRTEQLYGDALAEVQTPDPNMPVGEVYRLYGPQMALQQQQAQRSAAFDQRLQERRAGNLDLQRNAVAGRMGIDPGRLDYVPHNQPGYSRWFPRPMSAPEQAPMGPVGNVDALTRPMQVGVGNYPEAPPGPNTYTRPPEAFEPGQMQPQLYTPGRSYGIGSMNAPVAPFAPNVQPMETMTPTLPDPYAEKRAALQAYLERRRGERQERRNAMIRPESERWDMVHAREAQKGLARDQRLAYRAEMQLPPRPLTAEERMMMDPRTAAVMRGQNIEAGLANQRTMLDKANADRDYNLKREEFERGGALTDAEIRRSDAQAKAAEAEAAVTGAGIDQMNSEAGKLRRDLDAGHYGEPGSPKHNAAMARLNKLENPGPGMRPDTATPGTVTQREMEDYGQSQLRVRMGLPDDMSTMTGSQISSGVVNALTPMQGGSVVPLTDDEWMQAAGWASDARQQKPNAEPTPSNWTNYGVHNELQAMSRETPGSAKWNEARDRAEALARWEHTRKPYAKTGPTINGYRWTAKKAKREEYSGSWTPRGPERYSWSWEKVDK